MTLDLSLQQILLRIVAILFIGAVHGIVLVGMVSWFGDRGPKFAGRLTPNPLAHVDPMGLIVSIATLGGWIRPVQLDPAHLRNGRLSLVVSVLVSLAAVVIVALCLLPLRGLTVAFLPPSSSNLINLWLRVLSEMSVVFAVMNLIPLPPFTGGHLLQAVAPRLYATVHPRTTIIAIVVLVLAILDRGVIVGAVLGPLVRTITGF